LLKIVSRGDTTVVDAYLSPLLKRYVAQVTEGFNGDVQPKQKISREQHLVAIYEAILIPCELELRRKLKFMEG
jgi:N-methylhydantoinase A/oxoprolinase/acetone carboxylase beta subunit